MTRALFVGAAVASIGVIASNETARAQQVVAAQTSGGPLVGDTPKMTAEVSDPLFQQPYIDVDEWRDAPIRHRYVHGGFKGTETRFSFYFPEKAKYEGRFFQYITPAPDNENLSQKMVGEGDRIGFALSSGGYFIETNGGGRGMAGGPGLSADPTIAAFRANAASAQYSRAVAMAIYGGKRPYGYAFGGSGGAYRTIGGMENTRGVWDGAVPYVLGSPMAIPNMFTVRMYAQRVLGAKLAQVADAADAGGGDVYAGLNDEERAALVEITRMGFPLRGWHGWKTMGMGAFPVLYPGIVAADPSYFTDFWTKPGYEGFDPPKSLLDARIRHKTWVRRLITAEEATAMGLRPWPMMGQARGTADAGWQSMVGPDGGQLPVAIQLEASPEKRVFGTDLRAVSGGAAGRTLSVQRLEKDIVILGAGNAAALAVLKAGDEVQIDNDNFLAAQTYHRHQVPGPEYPTWDQYRRPDGTPAYPQRPKLIGPQFAKSTSGSVNDGSFGGKMILIENLMDIDALPWQGDWYRRKAAGHFGAGLNQHLRLWYIDRANHGDFERQANPTQTVSYLGVLQQALRDLAAWVEKGTPPAPTTSYRVVDGQVVVPAIAAQRRGIQPVVTLTANGGARTEVAAGTRVKLSATIDVPPGAGKIVSAEWDLDGHGSFAVQEAVPTPAPRLKFERSHSFDRPGTYFVTLRAASQRQGDRSTPFTRIQNLARVRVVVK